jgi:hypothetical protein
VTLESSGTIGNLRISDDTEALLDLSGFELTLAEESSLNLMVVGEPGVAGESHIGGLVKSFHRKAA